MGRTCWSRYTPNARSVRVGGIENRERDQGACRWRSGGSAKRSARPRRWCAGRPPARQKPSRPKASPSLRCTRQVGKMLRMRVNWCLSQACVVQVRLQLSGRFRGPSATIGTSILAGIDVLAPIRCARINRSSSGQNGICSSQVLGQCAACIASRQAEALLRRTGWSWRANL